jgi:uncharacterized damage-inducible protein DinB
MTTNEVQTMFVRSRQFLENKLEGVTEDDAFVTAEGGGNSINWILGHIVAYRNNALELVGTDQVLTTSEAAPYMAGSETITRQRARSFVQLKVDLSAAHDRLLETLQLMSDENLNVQTGAFTLGQRLANLAYHEGYHVGQIALLRRIMGKPSVK